MNKTSWRMGALVLAGATALILLLPQARSQIRVGPNYQAMGVAATPGGSIAWFLEPGSGRALACQTLTAAVGGGLSPIQCVATQLPAPQAP